MFLRLTPNPFVPRTISNLNVYQISLPLSLGRLSPPQEPSCGKPHNLSSSNLYKGWHLLLLPLPSNNVGALPLRLTFEYQEPNHSLLSIVSSSFPCEPNLSSHLWASHMCFQRFHFQNFFGLCLCSGHHTARFLCCRSRTSASCPHLQSKQVIFWPPKQRTTAPSKQIHGMYRFHLCPSLSLKKHSFLAFCVHVF